MRYIQNVNNVYIVFSKTLSVKLVSYDMIAFGNKVIQSDLDLVTCANIVFVMRSLNCPVDNRL